MKLNEFEINKIYHVCIKENEKLKKDLVFEKEKTKSLDEHVKQLQERLKEAELTLASIYNIDTKYIDTQYEDRLDMFYNDILDLVEDYQQKYLDKKGDIST